MFSFVLSLFTYTFLYISCCYFEISARNCGFPGDVENGWRTGYAFTYPNKVEYYCHDGFELQGSGYRVCQASGDWSDSLPSCTRKYDYLKLNINHINQVFSVNSMDYWGLLYDNFMRKTNILIRPWVIYYHIIWSVIRLTRCLGVSELMLCAFYGLYKAAAF